jgi:hypothetical protein
VVDVAVEDVDDARRDIYPKGKRVTATALPSAGAVPHSVDLSFPKMTRKRSTKICESDWNTRHHHT